MPWIRPFVPSSGERGTELPRGKPDRREIDARIDPVLAELEAVRGDEPSIRADHELARQQPRVVDDGACQGPTLGCHPDADLPLAREVVVRRVEEDLGR